MTDEVEVKQPRLIGHIAIDRVKELREQQKNPDLFRPVSTGLTDLDTLIGGLPRAKPFMLVILAKEKIGKTTLGLKLAANWAEQVPEGCIYFGLEEQDYELADRYLADLGNISRKKMFMLNLSDMDLDIMESVAYRMVETHKLYIQDEIFSFGMMVKQMKVLGVKLAWIDNFHLMDRLKIPGSNDREKLENLSRKIAQVRNTHKLSFGVLAQEGEEGKGFASHQINRDANIICSIEPMYMSQSDEQRRRKEPPEEFNMLRQITVRRSRAVPPGICEVAFDGDHSRIGDIKVKKIDLNSPTFFTDVEGGEVLT